MQANKSFVVARFKDSAEYVWYSCETDLEYAEAATRNLEVVEICGTKEKAVLTVRLLNEQP